MNKGGWTARYEGVLKLTTREQLVKLIEPLRKQGKRLGFTSGSFDLLHAGHVAYLQEARTLCEYLMVGINSDSSIKSYKDPARPINPQQARAAVVAALSCVDAVFLFDEINNNQNITELRPDIYIKAGDYDRSRLSSAAQVEAYGGEVKFVRFVDGYSSTRVIQRILDAYAPVGVIASEPAAPHPAPAIFLDRDGTLIEHVEYLHDPKKVRVIPGVGEGIRKLRAHGYWIVVVTNQPGIGLGYFTVEDFFLTNRAWLKVVGKEGAILDKIYFCPHSEAVQCECRKPELGMIRRAQRELPILLEQSVVVGDTTFDIELARRAGCKSLLVRTGQAGQDKRFAVAPDWEADDLGSAAELIIKECQPPERKSDSPSR